MGRSRLKINAEAIKENVRKIYEFTGKKIIAVVKSNAYGVGIEFVVPLLEPLEEIDAFAVACVEEGIELRKIGVRKEILILGGVLKGEVKALKEFHLTPVVSDPEHLKVLEDENIPFHINVDTGMGRLGFLEDIPKDPRVKGLMTHLSSPADREFSMRQLRKFEGFLKKFIGNSRMSIHVESSAGLIYKVPFATHVRVGLAIYGEKPLKEYPVDIKPALSFEAQVISVKRLPKGHPVSYGRTFVAQRDIRTAVVAVGYADGLMKTLSNRGYLLFKNKKLPILGAVTMDMTVVQVDGVNIKVGDWVEIVNPKRTFVDLARDAGTIPYEVMCNLSPRVERVIV